MALAEIVESLQRPQREGLAALPSPLPITPATRAAVGLGQLAPADERLLLFAAISSSDSAAVLLTAAAVEIDVLLNGAVARHLVFADGTYRFADDRVCAIVLNDSLPADRVSAHRGLARALRTHGLTGMAAWHECAGGVTIPKQMSTVLMSLVETRVAHGDFLTAYDMARFAAEISTGSRRSRALLQAARIALWCGLLSDAKAYLRVVMLLGDEGREEADELSAVIQLFLDGPTGSGDLKSQLVMLMTPLASAAMSFSDRVAMQRLVDISSAFLRRDYERADAIQAQLLLGVIPARATGSWSELAGALSPLAEAHVRLQQVAFQMQAEDFAGAANTLRSAIQRLPLVYAGSGIVSSYVRLIGSQVSDLDVSTASIFDRLAPDRTLGYSIFGVAIGQRTAAASAKALDRTVAEPTGENSTWSVLLTAREREVAHHASLGHSNQHIAEALQLSVRTVEVHLAKIYRKVGVSSRSQLVVRALKPPADRLGPGAMPPV